MNLRVEMIDESIILVKNAHMLKIITETDGEYDCKLKNVAEVTIIKDGRKTGRKSI